MVREGSGVEIVVVSHGVWLLSIWFTVTGTWRTNGVVRKAGVGLAGHRDGRWLGAGEETLA